jgi:hypothetical protein
MKGAGEKGNDDEVISLTKKISLSFLMPRFLNGGNPM